MTHSFWYNGALVPTTTSLDPADRGFLLAHGVFETLLTIDGKIIWGEEHIRRLFHGALILGIPTPYSQDDLLTACSDVIEANKAKNYQGIRITLTRGAGPRGLAPPPDDVSPTLLITTAEVGPMPTPPSLITAHTTTRNEKNPTAQLKTLSYTDNIIARQEAITADSDDALMLNTAGNLACATTANVFIWIDNTLLTPPCHDGCLPGITRRHFIDAAHKSGIQYQETSIASSQLEQCTAIVLTNSLTGAVFAKSCNGHSLQQPDSLSDLLRSFNTLFYATSQ